MSRRSNWNLTDAEGEIPWKYYIVEERGERPSEQRVIVEFVSQGFKESIDIGQREPGLIYWLPWL